MVSESAKVPLILPLWHVGKCWDDVMVVSTKIFFLNVVREWRLLLPFRGRGC